MNKIISLLVLTFLSGCASGKIGPEPSDLRMALVYGKLSFDYVDDDKQTELTKGYPISIELRFKNVKTGKIEVVTSSNSHGYFSTFKIEPGQYQFALAKIVIALGEGEGTYTIRGHDHELFDIQKGVANNLGQVRIIGNLDTLRFVISMFENTNDVESYFLEKNPNSDWLKRKRNDDHKLVKTERLI
ncbi:hypothetical protein [Vibrio sp. WXL103]|uniref:hypothetical protein n=1 Tax=Vibrio sp. WXL103 TaxID=3450710 RepID=UPI003EC65F49